MTSPESFHKSFVCVYVIRSDTSRRRSEVKSKDRDDTYRSMPPQGVLTRIDFSAAPAKNLPRIPRMNTNNGFAYFVFIRGKFFLSALVSEICVASAFALRL